MCFLLLALFVEGQCGAAGADFEVDAEAQLVLSDAVGLTDLNVGQAGSIICVKHNHKWTWTLKKNLFTVSLKCQIIFRGDEMT